MTIVELVAKWRKKAARFKKEASADRARSSVGLAQPKEWEASRLEDCAEELSVLAAPQGPAWLPLLVDTETGMRYIEIGRRTIAGEEWIVARIFQSAASQSGAPDDGSS